MCVCVCVCVSPGLHVKAAMFSVFENNILQDYYKSFILLSMKLNLELFRRTS